MRGVTKNAEEANNENVISTHTPHARRDREIVDYIKQNGIFQLTRLMRGVTYLAQGYDIIDDFNSHASCEA